MNPSWGMGTWPARTCPVRGRRSASAQDLNWTLCRGGQGIAQEGQVAGCSAVIQSRQESAKNRAYAYFIRAYVFAAQSDFDRAIVDLDQAIALDPNLPMHMAIAAMRTGQRGTSIALLPITRR